MVTNVFSFNIGTIPQFIQLEQSTRRYAWSSANLKKTIVALRAIEASHILQEEVRRKILRSFQQRQEVQKACRPRVLRVHPISNLTERLAWWAAVNGHTYEAGKRAAKPREYRRQIELCVALAVGKSIGLDRAGVLGECSCGGETGDTTSFELARCCNG